MKPVFPFLAGAIALTSAGAETSPVATGINRFGLELHHRLAADGGNRVASPWSIASALAMTYAGAAGKTRAEMAATLHLGDDEAATHAGIAAIAADLAELARASRERVENPDRRGGPETPLQIVTANRLFGQTGQPFEKPFIELLENTYAAPLEQVDFIRQAEAARTRINEWVEEQTRERIKDLIPAGVLNEETRLVLANAIYLKAAWAAPFREEPELVFHVDGTGQAKVPGLIHQAPYGYRRIPGGTLVSVPYEGGGLQFLIALPDELDGLAALEKQIDAALLAEAARLPKREAILRLPKFKLEPGRVMLAEHLKAMGMRAAFDVPQGTADFSRMAPRRPDDYLYIDNVIHKAFIDVNKDGTEAAAATAVVMMRATSIPDEPVEPLDIRVDRPFLFAVQHVASGTCLFLGRVTDPH
ncbi:MAG TPA: serpin family protein [Luteolibacter sp.]|nr:serpin family protein [Luteolibacter sp.]